MALTPSERALKKRRRAQSAIAEKLRQPYETRAGHTTTGDAITMSLDGVPSTREFQVVPGFFRPVNRLDIPAADLNLPAVRQFHVDARASTRGLLYDETVGSWKGRYVKNA